MGATRTASSLSGPSHRPVTAPKTEARLTRLRTGRDGFATALGGAADPKGAFTAPRSDPRRRSRVSFRDRVIRPPPAPPPRSPAAGRPEHPSGARASDGGRAAGRAPAVRG